MDELIRTSPPTPLVHETSGVLWEGVLGLLLVLVVLALALRWIFRSMEWPMPSRSRLLVVGSVTAVAIGLLAVPF